MTTGITAALHAGCPAPSAMPGPLPAFAHPNTMLPGFELPTFGGGAAGAIAMPAERFVSSMAGGVILDKDGAPAGRVPEGSFVDTKDGTIYGPDSKKLTVPEGATVDFFDLPDVKQLVADAKMFAEADAAATKPGGPADKGVTVSGQWGPGGTTSFPAGGAMPGCDMPGHGGAPGKVTIDQVPTHDPSGRPIPLEQRQKMLESINASMVGGAHGGGMPGPVNLAELQRQAAAAQAQLAQITAGGGMPPMKYPGQFYPPNFPSSANGVLAGGAVAGASGIGMAPGLQTSLADLVSVLKELTAALATTKAGGAPAAKTETKTETASSGSSSGSSSSSSSSST